MHNYLGLAVCAGIPPIHLLASRGPPILLLNCRVTGLSLVGVLLGVAGLLIQADPGVGVLIRLRVGAGVAVGGIVGRF